MNYLELAQQLADAALEHGQVITITAVPNYPPAMGSYTLKAESRPTRKPVEFCGNCDSPLPGGCGGCFRDETACALHVFDLDAMCAMARARVQDTIEATAVLMSGASRHDHTLAVVMMHQRHDQYLRRNRAWKPVTLRQVVLGMLSAFGSPR